MINSEAYLAFEQLLYSVRTGKPAFDKVFGSPGLDWLSGHPEQAALFQRAMAALSQGSNDAIAEAYDFRPFTRIIDVGGGHGQLLSAILTRNPHLSGVLFNLPSGVAKVLVVETLMPPGDEPNQIKCIDVIKLAVTGGLTEYAGLFEAAGLWLERLIQTRAPISILEASPT